MRTHLDIIRNAGGYKDLADKLGQPRERVRFWEKRESIPPEFWPQVSDANVASLEELALAVEAQKLPEVAERRAIEEAA